MIERRKYIRLDSTLEINYRIVSEKSHQAQATTKNISIGGVCVALKESIPLNTSITLQINLPDEKTPIIVTGKVVWQKEIIPGPGYDTGIMYTDIAQSDIQRITSYVLSSLTDKLRKNKDEIAGARRLLLLFTREIRLPGDNSRTIQPPNFLTHEVNLPGDKVRYARIKSSVGLKYRLLTGDNTQFTALSQYVSGKGVWFLAVCFLDAGCTLELEIELPKPEKLIKAIGEVVSCKEETRYDDTEIKTCYDTSVKFTVISSEDRKDIIRYVYACQADYIMIGRNIPGFFPISD